MTSINVKSFGCSANFAEGEIMKGLLAKEGMNIKEDSPDVTVVNVCTVKGDNQALKEIRIAKQNNENKKIVVAGCLTRSLINEVKKLYPEISLLNTHNIKNINSVVNETLANNRVEFLSKEKSFKLNLPKVRKNPIIGIVPIASGCDSACTFCSVKLVKGSLFSYQIQEIIREIEQCVKDGCKEIWLTSQDNGCYGLDIGTNLVKLLQEIVEIEGDFMIRVGMANPKHVVKFYKDLIQIYKHPKIFKFLHLPVQSGNNEILSAMKREHSAEDYKKVIERFREEIPELNLSTDVICGFPGETKLQFEDTLNLVSETQPDSCNISRFASRYGTPASIMTNVISGDEKRNRSRALTEVYESTSLKQNKKWINWSGFVLVDEFCKNNTLTGRNYAYKPVILRGDFKLGDCVYVKIIDATSFDLRAEVLNEIENPLKVFK